MEIAYIPTVLLAVLHTLFGLVGHVLLIDIKKFKDIKLKQRYQWWIWAWVKLYSMKAHRQKRGIALLSCNLNTRWM
jgi:hypothetical protein